TNGVELPAGTGSGGSHRVSVCLGDAQIAADLVLANLVDDEFLRLMSAAQVEEERLIDGAILVLGGLVLDGQDEVGAVLLLVGALEFDGDNTDLLGLILAGDGEFDVVALALAAEHVDLVMVTGNQGAQFAASHVEVINGLAQIGADLSNLGVDGLDVVGGRLGGEFLMDGSVKSGDLGSRIGIELFCFTARLLQLPLRDLQLIRDDLQFTLEVRVGLFVLGNAVLECVHIRLDGSLNRLHLIGDGLLGSIKLGRVTPSQAETYQGNKCQDDDRGQLPRRTGLRFNVIVL